MTTTHPDVIVVGAGLAGASVAMHLAATHRVLVLDQHEQPAAEASGQNSGMIRRLGEDPAERALAMRTADWLDDPGDDWRESPPSRRTGALLALAEDPWHLADGVAHLRAGGVRVEACDRPAELAPALAGSPLKRCWHLPDERVADAHTLVSGFLRLARRAGAELRCSSRVSEVLRDGERVVGVRVDGEELHAGAVVVAAGAWAGAFARDLGLGRPLVPVRRTVLHSAPHPLSRPDHPWCWIDDEGVYVRPESEGWLGSPCDEVVDPPGPNGGSTGPATPEQRARFADKLQRLMPAVADLRVEGGWTGLRTFAPDRRPILGDDPAAPGLWWAAGFGGFGVSCSYGLGEALGSWMRDQDTPWVDRGALSPARPHMRRWPIRPTGELRSLRLVPGLR